MCLLDVSFVLKPPYGAVFLRLFASLFASLNACLWLRLSLRLGFAERFAERFACALGLRLWLRCLLRLRLIPISEPRGHRQGSIAVSYNVKEGRAVVNEDQKSYHEARERLAAKQKAMHRQISLEMQVQDLTEKLNRIEILLQQMSGKS